LNYMKSKPSGKLLASCADPSKRSGKGAGLAGTISLQIESMRLDTVRFSRSNRS